MWQIFKIIKKATFCELIKFLMSMDLTTVKLNYYEDLHKFKQMYV
jgi:hypothetical protein